MNRVIIGTLGFLPDISYTLFLNFIDCYWFSRWWEHALNILFFYICKCIIEPLHPIFSSVVVLFWFFFLLYSVVSRLRNLSHSSNLNNFIWIHSHQTFYSLTVLITHPSFHTSIEVVQDWGIFEKLVVPVWSHLYLLISIFSINKCKVVEMVD